MLIKIDCLNLVQKLKRGKGDRSALGMIVSDIIMLTKHCSNFAFSHVGREGNFVAHTLAKTSISFNCMRVWLEEILPHIQSFVMADLMPPTTNE